MKIGVDKLLFVVKAGAHFYGITILFDIYIFLKKPNSGTHSGLFLGFVSDSVPINRKSQMK